jgi:Flp pilus assembly protein TadD
MAAPLKPLLLSISLLLGACSSLSDLSRPTTEEALQMHSTALLAYEGGEDGKAEALFQGLLRISPNDPETWLRLGNLYARSGRPDNAAEAYQRALLLSPTDDRLWYNLAVIRQRQSHAAYIQAQQLSPAGEEIYEKSSRLIKKLAPERNDDHSQAAPQADADANARHP